MDPIMIDSKGVPYDRHSIMHYGSYYFSKNNRPTIVDVNTNEPLQNVSSAVIKLFYRFYPFLESNYKIYPLFTK